MPEITRTWSDFQTATARSEQFKVWRADKEEGKVKFVISTSQFAIKGECPKKEFEDRLAWIKATSAVVVELADEPYIETSRLYN
jgi:hypothetical protein